MLVGTCLIFFDDEHLFFCCCFFYSNSITKLIIMQVKHFQKLYNIQFNNAIAKQ